MLFCLRWSSSEHCWQPYDHQPLRNIIFFVEKNDWHFHTDFGHSRYFGLLLVWLSLDIALTVRVLAIFALPDDTMESALSTLFNYSLFLLWFAIISAYRKTLPWWLINQEVQKLRSRFRSSMGMNVSLTQSFYSTSCSRHSIQIFAIWDVGHILLLVTNNIHIHVFTLLFNTPSFR